MRGQINTVEREIARIAGRQHGVVTRAQLLQVTGASSTGIERRVRRGILLPVHRGVYRVGHRAPSLEARYLAAVLAYGEGAFLSGPAAGHLLGLVKGRPPPPEVTTPLQGRVPGVPRRRTRATDRRDVTLHRNIPVTTVPRTLVDLAAVLTDDELAHAYHEASVLYRTTPAQVEAVLARRPNSPGAGALRRVLRGDVHVTLSELERRFLKLLREARLPPPRTNRPAGVRRVDCRWPDLRLTIELDSYRYHATRRAWELDRRREREARARGDEFRRYTYGDVFEEPSLMLRELRELLRRGARTAGPGRRSS